MGVVHNPASEIAKEMRKWEQHHTQFAVDEEGNSRPGNPYVYRPFPKMVYRAQKRANGQVACMVPPPMPFEYLTMAEYERADLEIMAFNRTCYQIVQNEQEHERARANGWRDDPKAALEYHESLEQDMARAAAEAQYAVKRMSEKARDEFKQAEDATSEHVTDVVKGGRGKKAKGVSATETE